MAQRARSTGCLVAGCLLGLVPASAPALAQAPAPGRPAAQAAADPAFEAARAAFEPLPEAERKGIQDALVWTGDYNSVITGAFGRRTYDALIAYQKRAGNPAPGFPDASTRAAILAAGETARKATRFAVKPDPASGIVIGVPERLLSRRSPQGGGTRWQSTDGRVTLDTKSFGPGETDLDALFARAVAPAADRKVTYKLKRPDFLVVTGETGTGKFYIRYASGLVGIRGFTLGYDKALGPEVDRLVIAIANSVVPFPETAEPVPAQAAPSVPAAKPGAPQAPTARTIPLPAARPAATVALGLVVAPGRVLTSASAIEACPAFRIGSTPVRVIRTDAARGLALLDADGLKARAGVVAARGMPLPPGDAVIVLGADTEGGVAVASGEVSGERLFAPLQPGSAGALVLDREGSLAGLVVRYPTAPRLVAGVAPPMSYPMVPGRGVSDFLDENGVAPVLAQTRTPDGAGASLGAVAHRAGAAVVTLACQP